MLSQKKKHVARPSTKKLSAKISLNGRQAKISIVIKGSAKFSFGSLGIKKFRCRRPPQPPLSFQLFNMASHGRMLSGSSRRTEFGQSHPTMEQTIHRHIGTIEYTTLRICGRGEYCNTVAREWRGPGPTWGQKKNQLQDDYTSSAG